MPEPTAATACQRRLRAGPWFLIPPPAPRFRRKELGYRSYATASGIGPRATRMSQLLGRPRLTSHIERPPSGEGALVHPLVVAVLRIVDQLQILRPVIGSVILVGKPRVYTPRYLCHNWSKNGL